MKNKFLTLLSVSLISSASVFAQVRTDVSVREKNNSSYDVGESGFNAHSFSIGVGLGSTKMYGDMPKSNPQPAYIGYFEKNISPFVSYGWTVSVGDLSARDPYTHMRSFNHFTSVDQHVTFEIGSLFTLVDRDFGQNFLLRLIGGLYAGVGVGIINNDVKRIANVDPSDLVAPTVSSNPVLLTNSAALYIPVNVGINLHVPKLWRFNGCVFNANFQYSSTMSDYIDGYKLPFVANKKNDVYTVMSVGFRFFVFQPSNDY